MPQLAHTNVCASLTQQVSSHSSRIKPSRVPLGTRCGRGRWHALYPAVQERSSCKWNAAFEVGASYVSAILDVKMGGKNMTLSQRLYGLRLGSCLSSDTR
jgi:hypothetical protein